MRNNEPGLTLIAKVITRLTVGLILIYGIYIVMQGHIGPGGGFAGGVIFALGFIHLMLAFGKDAVLKKLNQARCLFLASSGGILFLFFGAIILFSRAYAAGPEKYYDLFGASITSLLEIIIAVMVSAGLFAIFLALVLLSGSLGEKK